MKIYRFMMYYIEIINNLLISILMKKGYFGLIKMDTKYREKTIFTK
jgi:hypothetical protein